MNNIEIKSNNYWLWHYEIESPQLNSVTRQDFQSVFYSIPFFCFCFCFCFFICDFQPRYQSRLSPCLILVWFAMLFRCRGPFDGLSACWCASIIIRSNSFNAPTHGAIPSTPKRYSLHYSNKNNNMTALLKKKSYWYQIKSNNMG